MNVLELPALFSFQVARILRGLLESEQQTTTTLKRVDISHSCTNLPETVAAFVILEKRPDGMAIVLENRCGGVASSRATFEYLRGGEECKTKLIASESFRSFAARWGLAPSILARIVVRSLW